MRAFAFLVALFATSCVDLGSDPTASRVPVCDISVARIGEWIEVDIATTCVGGDWMLEYRLLGAGTVTVNEREDPCGSLTRVSLLATPSLVGSFRVTGALHDDRIRIDCVVSSDR